MPHTFRNGDNQEFAVHIDGRVLHRARTHGSVKLGDLSDGVDVAVLLELCYYGCEQDPKIRGMGLSKDQFLAKIVGPCFMPAVQATGKALAECFGVPTDGIEEPAGADGNPPPASPGSGTTPTG
jgi:hypothetical protein